jgi:hypothetical protein
MWEDPENKLGGKWVLTVPKGRNRSLVDQWWMNMVRACSMLLLFYYTIITCSKLP